MSERKKQLLHEKLCAVILGEATEAERIEVEAALAESETLRAEKLRIEATIGLVQETLGAPPEAQLSGAARAELTAAAGSIDAVAGASAPAANASPGTSPSASAGTPVDTILRPVPRRWYQSVPLGLVGAAAAVLLAWVGLKGLGEKPAPAGGSFDGDVARLTDGDEADARVESKNVGGYGLLAEREREFAKEEAGRALAAGLAPAEDKPAGGTGGLQAIGYADGELTAGRRASASEAEDLSKLGYLELSAMGYAEGADSDDSGVGLKDQLVLELLGFDFEPGQDKSDSGDLESPTLRVYRRGASGQDDGSRAQLGVALRFSGEPEKADSVAPGGAYRGAGDSVPSGGDAGAGNTISWAPHPSPPPLVFPPPGLSPFVGSVESSPSTSPPAGPALTGATAAGRAPATGVLRGENRKKQNKGAGAPSPFVDGADGEAGDFWMTTTSGLDGATVNELLALGERRAAGATLEDYASLGLAPVTEVDTGSEEFFLGHGSKQSTRRRGLQLTPQQRADLVLRHCRRLPNEHPRDMFFRFWGDNPFELTAFDRLSTFSVDVDTASYALARRYVKEGRIPEKAQVRTEEFVNYFDSGVASPTEETFAIDLELAPSRFGDSADTWMMRVVVRGKDVAMEERDPVALTFVVDVSGSMKEGGRLEMVKHALRLLMSQLDGRDSIAIVAYSTEARVVLPMTSAANRAVVEEAIHQLQHGGGTNAEAGLRLGYALAVGGGTSGAQNRVVLLSDGVANIGQTDQDKLNDDVRIWREKGIYLNTVGVGMNNHNDTFLEQLANKGDGVCNYIDDAAEAKRVLVDNFTGAFQVIARDAKIQVEFDPAQVERYRLLGYENRVIADRDFRNDAVDAGEVGAGHQVTALYELVRFGTGDPDGPLATVRVRYKAPHGKSAEGAEGESAHEIERSIDARQASGSWSGTTPGFRQAALVAQYAEFLRRSRHARQDSYETLVAEVDALRTTAPDPAFAEFTAVVQRTLELLVATAPPRDQLTEAVDALRRNRYLAALSDDLQEETADELLADLERQNAVLEARVRRLLERAR